MLVPVLVPLLEGFLGVENQNRVRNSLRRQMEGWRREFLITTTGRHIHNIISAVKSQA